MHRMQPVVCCRTHIGFAKTVEIEEQISIYPNPSRDIQHLEIVVSTEVESNIKVLNSQGKKVLDIFNGNLSPNIKNKMTIELGDLPNGIYFCMINLNGKSYQKKIIKI